MIFIWPVWYSENISLNSVPEITTEVNAGKYKHAFHNPFALTSLESISTANSIGKGIKKTSVKSIYSALFKIAVWNTVSFKSLEKFLNPTHSVVAGPIS
ncbi:MULTISPECIES: hypothetical protein [Eisenbergiella]|uniref:hypothetical protein n=1 Tax=Eisenbergiella TaxID=1432051 RepID=UPI002F40C087